MIEINKIKKNLNDFQIKENNNNNEMFANV